MPLKIKIKSGLRKGLDFLFVKSIRDAVKEQKLGESARTLKALVPDITDTRTRTKLDVLACAKSRGLHAFQMSLLNNVLYEFERPVVVDIGDASGTHLQYLLGLYKNKKDIQCMGVNLDAEAVKRIKEKGLDAIHARAEEVEKYNVHPDVFLSFEMLEHLMDPCRFLHDLSLITSVKYFVITVPFLRNSRVGMRHIRQGIKAPVYAENTHIFEFSPGDWRLLFQHSGWSVEEEKVYLQYPRRGLLRFTSSLWRKFDFEGYYGAVLKRDPAWLNCYADW